MRRSRLPDAPEDLRRDDDWPGVSARLAALHGRRPPLQRQHWSPKVWITSIVMAVVVLGAVFAVVARHYDDSVLTANVCPSTATVNARLGTTVDKVTGIQLSDFHTCSYAQGTDSKALSIDVAHAKQSARSVAGHLCARRPTFTVRGHTACSLSGTSGTTPGRPSLLVATNDADWQFTTNLSSVSLAQLEVLATALLTSGGSHFA